MNNSEMKYHLYLNDAEEHLKSMEDSTIDLVVTSCPYDSLRKYNGIGDTWFDGSVALTELGAAAVPGTQEAIDAAIAQFKAGTLKVFDLSKFTVGGNVLADDTKADVDTDANFTKDTVVIKTAGDIKYYAESEFRSAPYFDLCIDGITFLNTAF